MTTTITEGQDVKISDTPLAVYLITEGYKVKDIEYKGQRAYMVFPNDCEALQESIKLFQRGSATTNANNFIHNYKQLVYRIKNQIPIFERHKDNGD